MQRRDLLKLIAALTGSAFLGNDELFAAELPKPAPYSDPEVEFFGDVAETILPSTDTPGAREAGIGPFIARYSAACYPPEHVAILKSGLVQIEADMRKQYGKGYWQASAEEKRLLLVEIDRQAKEHAHQLEGKPDGAPHYFTLLKQLTLYGFFTSEAGATRLVRYRPIPGPYKGCVPYTAGETFWAW
jgi:hypothetical protein